MARIAYWAAVALLLAAAVAWYLFGRPGVEAASTVDPEVTIQCRGSASASVDACREWGDAVLADGPPSTTFELEDVVRVRLDRPLVGDECRAEYFLGRYPDEVAWAASVACPTAD
jgi:hypothetical protein